MNSTFSRGNWILTLSLAASAVAYFMLVFLPGRRAAASLQQEIEQNQQLIAQATASAPLLTATQIQLDQTHAFTQKWLEHAPDEGTLAELYGRVTDLAQESGAQITRFDPAPAEPLVTINRIPLEMGLSGSFSQIYGFLDRLEAQPETAWIGQLSMERERDIRKDGQSIQCEIGITVFSAGSDNSDQVENSE